MTEKDFFVGIYNPKDVKRNVLESSRQVLDSLQSNTKLKKIRYEKIKYYEQMNKIMNELDLLISRLQKKLPKSKLRKNYSKKTEKTHSGPGMSKVEEQLSKIEKEFSNLNKKI
jgi:hypothetical protein